MSTSEESSSSLTASDFNNFNNSNNSKQNEANQKEQVYLDEGFSVVYNKKAFKKKVISSYAIVIHTLIKGKIRYLVGKLRDTIAYREYLKFGDQKLIPFMTSVERKRCITFPFSVLISDVFYNKKSRSFQQANSNAINWSKQLERDRNLLLQQGEIEEIWMFPKGRTEQFESGIDTAIRELGEETGINTRLIVPYHDIEPVEEIFTGLDHNRYRTVYFLGFLEPKYLKGGLFRENFSYFKTELRSTLSPEIADMEWMGYSEAYEKLDETKRCVLRYFHTRLLFGLSSFPLTRSQSY